jgi:hypothetical protein
MNIRSLHVFFFIVISGKAASFSSWRMVRTSHVPTPSTTLYAASRIKDDSSGNGGGGGGLVKQSDNVLKSQLLNAFTNLDTADQYDAVLTGLCAKILDDATITDSQAIVSIQDCTDLLDEMNTSRIPASPRSLMALIDVRAHTRLHCIRP